MTNSQCSRKGNPSTYSRMWEYTYRSLWLDNSLRISLMSSPWSGDEPTMYMEQSVPVHTVIWHPTSTHSISFINTAATALYLPHMNLLQCSSISVISWYSGQYGTQLLGRRTNMIYRCRGDRAVSWYIVAGMIHRSWYDTCLGWWYTDAGVILIELYHGT